MRAISGAALGAFRSPNLCPAPHRCSESTFSVLGPCLTGQRAAFSQSLGGCYRVTSHGPSAPGCGLTALVVAVLPPPRVPALPQAPQGHGIAELLKLWAKVPLTSKATGLVKLRSPCSRDLLKPFPRPGNLHFIQLPRSLCLHRGDWGSERGNGLRFTPSQSGAGLEPRS